VKNAICAVCRKENPENATHRSLRDIKPHLTKEFLFSTGSHFSGKLTDVAVLYQRDNAIVMCVDEKSRIPGAGAYGAASAAWRAYTGVAQRGLLPARNNNAVRGTGYAYGQRERRVQGAAQSSDFILFLRKSDKECGQDKALHIIPYNYFVHKSKETKEYPWKHEKRFVPYFILAHSSWLNMVEMWFAEITSKRIRRELGVRDTVDSGDQDTSKAGTNRVAPFTGRSSLSRLWPPSGAEGKLVMVDFVLDRTLARQIKHRMVYEIPSTSSALR